jgi:hypothetical protein
MARYVPLLSSDKETLRQLVVALAAQSGRYRYRQMMRLAYRKPRRSAASKLGLIWNQDPQRAAAAVKTGGSLGSLTFCV